MTTTLDEIIETALANTPWCNRNYKIGPLFACLLPQTRTANFEANTRVVLGMAVPRDISEAGLSSISLYYNYCNPPPYAYGDPIPKTAESILRAKKYNKGSENTNLAYDPRTELNWMFSTTLPIDNAVGSDWEPLTGREAAEAFCDTYLSKIEDAAKFVLEFIKIGDPGVLSKGRQTWDPITGASVPAAQAYMYTLDLFRKNGIALPSNCQDFIHIMSQLFKLDKLKYTTKELVVKTTKRTINNREFTKVTESYDVVEKEAEGEEKELLLKEWITSFCSYLKSAERGKLNRRAIASANVFLRMFMLIIEKFHLNLAKRTEGSTIAIGGVEKLNHMQTVISKGAKYANWNEEVQLTADATKFNECINAEFFALFHYVMRSRCSEEVKMFFDLAIVGFYLIANKRMYSGGGPIAISDYYFNRLNWMDSELSKFNSTTQIWLEEYRKLRIGRSHYVFAPHGMLMGMFNATASNVVYAAALLQPNNVTELRSSDDSTSVYVAAEGELETQVNLHLENLKRIGVNLSPAKSFFANRAFFEFTSQYCDGTFTPLYTADATKIRPNGVNPYDDFGAIASNTSNALTNREINHPGATAMLVLGFNNVRRLWRIEVTAKAHHPESRLVVFMADGGDPWCNSTSCQISEAGFRYGYAKDHPGADNTNLRYVLSVINPNTPFNREPMEKTEYSKVSGELEQRILEAPRNVFTMSLRSNRTIKNSKKGSAIMGQKNCTTVASLMSATFPTISLFPPSEVNTIADALTGRALTLFNQLAPEERTEENSRLVREIARKFGMRID